MLGIDDFRPIAPYFTAQVTEQPRSEKMPYFESSVVVACFRGWCWWDAGRWGGSRLLFGDDACGIRVRFSDWTPCCVSGVYVQVMSSTVVRKKGEDKQLRYELYP